MDFTERNVLVEFVKSERGPFSVFPVPLHCFAPALKGAEKGQMSA